MNIEIPEKELTHIKNQITKANSASNDLIIDSEESMVKATELLTKVKAVGKIIDSEKLKILTPARLVVENIRKFFKPFEDQCLEAEIIIKRKMIVYQTEQERKADIEIAKVESKLKKDKITFDEAEEKIAEVEVAKKVESKSGSVSFRINRVPVIEDESLLPREYLIPDNVLIRKDALAGKEIPGVKIVEEKVVANIKK